MIGGNNSYDNNDNKYNLNLLSTELSLIYSKNIIFDSYNGSIYISGFDQRNTMNGIKNGQIKFIASTINIIY